MNYRFSNYEGRRKAYIRLVLKTEDSHLYRAGDVLDYPDVDTKRLDALVLDFFSAEKQKAMAFGAWLGSGNGQAAAKELLRANLKVLQPKARELFLQMEATEDIAELTGLNEAFTVLTEKMLKMERAVSFQNPWYQYYKNLEDPAKAVERIVVNATITDPTWFQNPLYPEEKNYARFGMKNAKVKGKKAQPNSQGREMDPARSEDLSVRSMENAAVPQDQTAAKRAIPHSVSLLSSVFGKADAANNTGEARKREDTMHSVDLSELGTEKATGPKNPVVAHGRGSPANALPQAYKEPALAILSYVPTAFFEDSRDIFSQAWEGKTF